MGDYAYLTVGTKYKFASVKYQIPYSWSMIFEDTTDTKGVYKVDANFAKNRLYSTGLTLDDLEEHISQYSEGNARWWKRHRDYALRIGRESLKEDYGSNNKDEEYKNFLDQLEQIEIDEGLFELVALYELLLALEAATSGQKVRLDLRDFKPYYDDFSNVLPDVKRHFTDIVNTHNYLFSHNLPNNDQVERVLIKIQGLKEDEIIDNVMLPLLLKMGFHDVKRIAHHGPAESGLDIPLFYEFDKFNSRIYYGVQVKAIDIHTNSRRDGHAESVSNQLLQALHSKFIDQEDNEEKQADRVILVTARKVNEAARKVFHRNFPNRTLIIMDGKTLAENIVRYGLIEKILQTRVQRRYHLNIKDRTSQKDRE